ncbi:hypothetical protein [Bacillus toyonensis]|nr:hypothetical protein [Bacillus toyonensis]
MKTININGTDKEVDFVRVDQEGKTISIFFGDKTMITLNDITIVQN